MEMRDRQDSLLLQSCCISGLEPHAGKTTACLAMLHLVPFIQTQPFPSFSILVLCVCFPFTKRAICHLLLVRLLLFLLRFKQKDILDIKCPRCRVRLVSLHLIAIHFKSCNPYAEKLERVCWLG